MLEHQATKDETKVVGEYLSEFRAGNFDKSMQALDTLLKREKSPVFGYATLMKNRIEELKKAPLPKNWDGVYTAETK